MEKSWYLNYHNGRNSFFLSGMQSMSIALFLQAEKTTRGGSGLRAAWLRGAHLERKNHNYNKKILIKREINKTFIINVKAPHTATYK